MRTKICISMAYFCSSKHQSVRYWYVHCRACNGTVIYVAPVIPSGRHPRFIADALSRSMYRGVDETWSNTAYFGFDQMAIARQAECLRGRLLHSRGAPSLSAVPETSTRHFGISLGLWYDHRTILVDMGMLTRSQWHTLVAGSTRADHVSL
jgi:hypothetical protein